MGFAMVMVPCVALAQPRPGADGGAAAIGSSGTEVDPGADEDVPEDAEDSAESEAESLPGTLGADGGLLYSADLSDQELEQRFLENIESLGSISVGFAEAGRVINAVQMPEGDAWEVVAPDLAWGTQDTIDFLTTAARLVRDLRPDAPRLRISHIGKRDGGYLRPHRTHQSGRDVDLGFYYRAGVDHTRLRGRREHAMDLDANWALIRALVVHTDVQVILVDRRVKAKLLAHALAAGEDRQWLAEVFRGGRGALIQHARGHRDHFHVRFFSGRSQELGRRVQPLLAKRPDQNLIIHRIRRGETLSHIARRYQTTVRLIQRANRVAGSLRVGRTLAVPLRGPCTRCPEVPPLVIPPRRLPPAQVSAGTPTSQPSKAAP